MRTIIREKSISNGKQKKADFMKFGIMWIVEYTSSKKFSEKFGFSLTITRQFKSENEAVEFMKQISCDDTNNGTYRNIMIYHC